MGILDRILGSDKAPKQGQATQQRGQPSDDQAIARYRYLLKTAPPETIEQAHAEAFARLTPEQRRMVLQQLSASVPETERAAVAPNGPDSQALARMATRAEVRQPGTMEQTFGRMGGGVGLGGLMAGSQALSPTGPRGGYCQCRNYPVVSERRDQGASINKFIVKQPTWVREATFPSLQRTAPRLETEVTSRFMGSILGSASRTPLRCPVHRFGCLSRRLGLLPRTDVLFALRPPRFAFSSKAHSSVLTFARLTA